MKAVLKTKKRTELVRDNNSKYENQMNIFTYQYGSNYDIYQPLSSLDSFN